MQEYSSKAAFIAEIQKTAGLYIAEFSAINEEDKDLRLEKDEKTPYENLSYQLGWMALIRRWDGDEQAGKEVVMPAPGVKWNQMAPLHQQFYTAHQGEALSALIPQFNAAVQDLCAWLDAFTDEDLFQPGGRKWAASTSSGWPVWKWVHINTVAPFKSFRSKIRKWKKLRAAQ